MHGIRPRTACGAAVTHQGTETAHAGNGFRLPRARARPAPPFWGWHCAAESISLLTEFGARG